MQQRVQSGYKVDDDELHVEGETFYKAGSEKSAKWARQWAKQVHEEPNPPGPVETYLENAGLLGYLPEMSSNTVELLPVFLLVFIVVLTRVILRRRGTTAPTRPVPSEPHIKELFVYPIKSCKGVSVPAAKISKWGFFYDRHWMLISRDNNRFLTQRQLPKMALIEPQFKGGNLILRYPFNDTPLLKIPLSPPNDTETVEVGVWADTVPAVLERREAGEWFEKVLGRPNLDLVRMTKEFPRQVPEESRSEKSPNLTSFSDAYPFLVISTASLADLNKRLAVKGKEPVSMANFRPNIVIESATQPFAEDEWGRVKIGNVLFKGSEVAARCKMPTNNPQTGQFDKDNEPTVTLQSYRCKDKQVYFGMLLIQESAGEVKLGDQVTILEPRSPPELNGSE